jgi:hypothetical protein
MSSYSEDNSGEEDSPTSSQQRVILRRNQEERRVIDAMEQREKFGEENSNFSMSKSSSPKSSRIERQPPQIHEPVRIQFGLPVEEHQDLGGWQEG